MQIENIFVPFTSTSHIAMSGIFFSLRQDLKSVTEKKSCPNVLKNYGLLLSKYMQSLRGKIDHPVSRSNNRRFYVQHTLRYRYSAMKQARELVGVEMELFKTALDHFFGQGNDSMQSLSIHGLKPVSLRHVYFSSFANIKSASVAFVGLVPFFRCRMRT
jgi:hypothetical protein